MRLTWRKLQEIIPNVKNPDKFITLWCEGEDFGVFAYKDAHLHTYLLEDNEFRRETTWKELNDFINTTVKDLDAELTVIFGQQKSYINDVYDDVLIAIEDYYKIIHPEWYKND